MIRSPTLGGLASALALAACNLAPAYRPPAMATVPATFKEAPGWAAAAPADAAAKGAWWTSFGDPVLDGLEQRVAVTNQNVAAARAAYAAARALVQVQRSALFPTVTGSASGTHSGAFDGSTTVVTPTTGTGAGSVTTTTTGSNRYSLSIGASWEPDLWGRLGNGVTQARATAEATSGDLANATLSAQGELATDYLQLRGIDAQRVLLDRTITAYGRALTITRNKYAAGTVAHSDVYQAQTSLSNAQASRQDLDRQRALLEHAVAVLVGENPSSFAIAPVAWTPVVPAVPPILPSSLLERRPDVAAAERRVAAANANIGIQRAAYFPQFGLSGSLGTNGGTLGSLFTAATSLWSVGLSTAATLLDFGARKGQVRQSVALFDEAAATYRQTALSAFQQVEDNLAATRILALETASRADAAESSTRAETIANNQYLSGIIDYSSVIVTQTTAYSARQAQIQAVIDQQTAAVALIQAIGGGWSGNTGAGSGSRKDAVGS
jgi:NodT family efflux transporter outer membrane factor (OMF) lipoprotein